MNFIFTIQLQVSFGISKAALNINKDDNKKKYLSKNTEKSSFLSEKELEESWKRNC